MGNFVPVPTALLDAVADSDSDLDGLAIAVWTALRSYADFGSEEGAAVRDQMAAARAGCSVSTFKRRRNRLLNAGWIDWESGQDLGVVNRYTVHDAPRVGQTELPLDQKDPLGSLTESDIPRASIPRANTDLENAARDVFDYWRNQYEQLTERIAGPRKRLTQNRKKKVLARLKEGYTVEQLCEAIDGCLGLAYNIENGYTDLELISRDDAHVDRYQAAAQKNGRQSDDSLKRSRAELLALENVEVPRE